MRSLTTLHLSKRHIVTDWPSRKSKQVVHSGGKCAHTDNTFVHNLVSLYEELTDWAQEEAIIFLYQDTSGCIIMLKPRPHTKDTKRSCDKILIH